MVLGCPLSRWKLAAGARVPLRRTIVQFRHVPPLAFCGLGFFGHTLLPALWKVPVQQILTASPHRLKQLLNPFQGQR